MKFYGQLFFILALLIGLHQANDQGVLRVNVEFLYDKAVANGYPLKAEGDDVSKFIPTLVRYATELLKRPGLNMDIDLHVVTEKQVMTDVQDRLCPLKPADQKARKAQFSFILIHNSSFIEKTKHWQHLVNVFDEGLCNPNKSCAEVYYNGNMETLGHNIARALVMSMGAGRDGTYRETPCDQHDSIMQINSTINSDSVWSTCTVLVVQDFIKRNKECVETVENKQHLRFKREDSGYDTHSGEELTDKLQIYEININATVNIDIEN